MALTHGFEHLPLPLRIRAPAKMRRRPSLTDETRNIKADRAEHSLLLSSRAAAHTQSRKERIKALADCGAPQAIQVGIPLLLKVDPNQDLDELAERFQFEIVSEEEDGLIIFASKDIDLAEFQAAVAGFSTNTLNTWVVGSVHEFVEDSDQWMRLQRVLSAALLAKWPTLDDTTLYIVDFGVVCVGPENIPPRPERGKKQSDAEWAMEEAQWAEQRARVYVAWDELKAQRETEVRELIHFYGGSLLGIHDELTAGVIVLPDSFSMRVRLPGRGLRDLVINYPFIFEVVEPEDILHDESAESDRPPPPPPPTIRPPSANAPVVCVIDSGIQEAHPLLEPAVDRETSRCLLPNQTATDVADYVRGGGHGTRVAGAVLHGAEIPTTGTHEAQCWVQNARVLDHDLKMPEELLPPLATRAAVIHFHKGSRETRIFNQSINTTAPYRFRHMSAWAAELDNLSVEHDVLIVQSAGNLPLHPTPNSMGIEGHLQHDRHYPSFLNEAGSRIANPGQSLHALTVGSVARGDLQSSQWQTFARHEGQPSAFTRTGFGIWHTIKPDVVEYGGDAVHLADDPLTVGHGGLVPECCPALVRSTMHGPGPLVDRDAVGTSFSTPMVARIAAELQRTLPEGSAQLYRALIVQSARWPEWEWFGHPESRMQLLRWLGFGIPDIERATRNTDHRTTSITHEDERIKAGECHIYEVPIPGEMRSSGTEYPVLIEVTLAFVAVPRRTRRHLRRYLSTWVNWKSSKLGESAEVFRRRVLKVSDDSTAESTGDALPWMLHEQSNWGQLDGIGRTSGSVQKDWAVVSSYQLPPRFCVAVIGHQGWNHDPDAQARYALTVSFEMLDRNIPIYEAVRAATLGVDVEIEDEAMDESDGEEP
jgi:hypothetical protein